MSMNRIQRLLPVIFVIFGVLVMGGAAFAAPRKATHHDAHKLLGDNLHHDGHHDIDHKGKYTASVEVQHAKIAAFHVKHSEKGEIAVKKVKTHKRYAQAARHHLVYASWALPQDMDMGTVYIGYTYTDEYGNEETYWFPEEEILDGDTGAVEYVPLS